jgi:medium-chain acyl-[acyl-carrier-protein] hydrolase
MTWWWTGSAPDARMQLLCFPYAGGATAVFRPWQPPLAGSLRLHAPRLPGRETRHGERAIDDMGALIDALASTFPAEPPYAMFGHSLGAIVAFELARRLRSAGRPLPVHLFAAGSPAPDLRQRVDLGELPSAELWAKLRTLDGTPAGVLDSPELRELVEPMLRTDFLLSDRYIYTEQPPLPCPVTVLRGAADRGVSAAQAAGWARHTSGPCVVEVFEGDHFFIASARDRVVALVERTLRGQR